MNNKSKCFTGGDTQTRENNGEYVNGEFCPLFSSVWISRWDTSSSCSYGFLNESRRNRMFWFADLNRISNQAYRTGFVIRESRIKLQCSRSEFLKIRENHESTIC